MKTILLNKVLTSLNENRDSVISMLIKPINNKKVISVLKIIPTIAVRKLIYPRYYFLPPQTQLTHAVSDSANNVMFVNPIII